MRLVALTPPSPVSRCTPGLCTVGKAVPSNVAPGHFIPSLRCYSVNCALRTHLSEQSRTLLLDHAPYQLAIASEFNLMSMDAMYGAKYSDLRATIRTFQGDDTTTQLLSELCYIPEPDPNGYLPSILSARFQHISELLLSADQDSERRPDLYWSRRPRIYTVLQAIGAVYLMPQFCVEGFTDLWFPFDHRTLPQFVHGPLLRQKFLDYQVCVLSEARNVEAPDPITNECEHVSFVHSGDEHYRKIKDLGNGTYGSVDQVFSKLSTKFLARKRVHRANDSKKARDFQKDVVNEIRVLKRLRHAHLVTILGSYTDPEYIAYLMQPIADMNLQEYLDRMSHTENRVSTQFFFGCLASAMAYLHENNVRHRDLKPRNVLIKDKRVYLADFGHALDFHLTGRSTTHHHVGGTEEFWSPEQARRQPRNTKSEMWSLGLIYLHLITFLKGVSLKRYHSLLRKRAAETGRSNLAYDHPQALSEWLTILSKNTTLRGINDSLEWTRSLLDANPEVRMSPDTLFKTISDSPFSKDFACSGCQWSMQAAASGHHDFRPPLRRAETGDSTLRTSVEKTVQNFKSSLRPAQHGNNPERSQSINRWREDIAIDGDSGTSGGTQLPIISSFPDDPTPPESLFHTPQSSNADRESVHSMAPSLARGTFDSELGIFVQTSEVDESENLSVQSERGLVDLEGDPIITIVEDTVSVSSDISFAQSDCGVIGGLECIKECEESLNTPLMLPSAGKNNGHLASFPWELDATKVNDVDDALRHDYNGGHTTALSSAWSVEKDKSPITNDHLLEVGLGILDNAAEAALSQGSAIGQPEKSQRSVTTAISFPQPTSSANVIQMWPATLSHPEAADDAPKIAAAKLSCREKGRLEIDRETSVQHVSPKSSDGPRPTAQDQSSPLITEEAINAFPRSVVGVDEGVESRTIAPTKKVKFDSQNLVQESKSDDEYEKILFEPRSDQQKRTGVTGPHRDEAGNEIPTDSNLKPEKLTSVLKAQSKTPDNKGRSGQESDAPKRPSVAESRSDQTRKSTGLGPTSDKPSPPHEPSPLISQESRPDSQTRATVSNTSKAPTTQTTVLKDRQDLQMPSTAADRTKDKYPIEPKVESRKRSAPTRSQKDPPKDKAQVQQPVSEHIMMKTRTFRTSNISRGGFTTNFLRYLAESSTTRKVAVENVSKRRRETRAKFELSAADLHRLSSPTSSSSRSPPQGRNKRVKLSAGNLNAFNDIQTDTQRSTRDGQQSAGPTDAKSGVTPMNKLSPASFIESALKAMDTAESEATTRISESSRGFLGGIKSWFDKDQSLLERYCKAGLPGEVKYLLERRCNPGTMTRPRPRPLVLAIKGASQNHYKCAKALINHGCNVNARLNGTTPLNRLLDQKNFQSRSRLLARLLVAGAEINDIDADGNYPILKVFAGSPTASLDDYCVETLILLLHPALQTAVDVNVKQSVTGNTALHLAVRRRSAVAVAILILRGAEVNAVNASETTPLLLAASQWDGDLTDEQAMILEYLLEPDEIDLNTKGGSPCASALHLAVRAGSPLAVEMLLESGADVASLDDKNKTPLDWLRQYSSKLSSSVYREIRELIRRYQREARKSQEARPNENENNDRSNPNDTSSAERTLNWLSSVEQTS